MKIKRLHLYMSCTMHIQALFPGSSGAVFDWYFARQHILPRVSVFCHRQNSSPLEELLCVALPIVEKYQIWISISFLPRKGTACKLGVLWI